MKNRTTKALFLILFTLFAACDDFVEVDPKGPVASNYFNTQEEYEDALIGVYDMLQSTFWNVLTSVVASDDMVAGGDASNLDQPTLQRIDKMDHTPADNNQLRDIWSFMYAGMNRANYVLEFKDKTDFAGKDELIAEVYFLRAYFAFELVKFYGNVPFKTEERDGIKRIANERVLPGDQYTMERTTDISEAYTLIEEDLKEAIASLPITQAHKYEITKGAAQALLGKVYLYHAKFDDTKFAAAASEFEDVITGMQYSLRTGNDYLNLFEEKEENSPESVFEIQYSGVEGASWDCIHCSEGSYFPKFTAPRSPYSDTEFDAGWGFCLPTQALYDAFDPADQRIAVTFLDLRNATNYSESRENTGFFNRKYLPRLAEFRVPSDPLNFQNNYRSIRYADVLLMAAEANVRKASPDVPKAQGYLDQVRDRAFGNTTNRVPATLDNIINERRLELAGEGHRFFDLVRTGQAPSKITGFTANKNEIFPIPSVELGLANATQRWGQNPGY